MKNYIEIAFGLLFKVRNEPERTDVIIGVGKKSYFEAARAYKTVDGYRINPMAGTAGPENYETKVGQLTLQEVLDGADRETQERWGQKLPQAMRDLLEEASKAKPRRITL